MCSGVFVKLLFLQLIWQAAVPRLLTTAKPELASDCKTLAKNSARHAIAATNQKNILLGQRVHEPDPGHLQKPVRLGIELRSVDELPK